jgi:hypothetical protein
VSTVSSLTLLYQPFAEQRISLLFNLRLYLLPPGRTQKDAKIGQAIISIETKSSSETSLSTFNHVQSVIEGFSTGYLIVLLV